MKKTTLLPAILLIFIAVITGSSCDKIRKDKGIIASEPEMSACFSPDNPTGEWVIRTQAEYDSLRATTGCTAAPETIDFTTCTLLGKYTTAGCNSRFFRQVLRKDEHKTIHYNILVKSRKRACNKSSFSYNWVLVPKFPGNYTVEFYVEEK
jgi:hypothetical protein